MSFWDVVWFIIIVFVFTAYLMMLFSIIADLFRDPETSGVKKALWMIGLIFLPLLIALVYIIVRGNDMARRTATSHLAAQQAQEKYIKQVAGATSATDQIAQASAMLNKGTISQSEFDTLKAKALAV
jgi:hypothetical protein